MSGTVRDAAVVVPRGTDPALLALPVGGVPLFARTLLALRRAGVERVRLVGEAPPLPADPRLAALQVAPAAPDALPEAPQFVLPATLVWDHRLLRDLAAAPGTAGGGVLCRDGGGARAAATRLLEDAGAHPPPAQALLVRSAADAPAALRLLLRAAGKDTDGVVSRHLNRPASQACTRLLVDTAVTPNAVTAAVSLVGVAAAGLVLAGGYANTAAGALLFALNSLLDGVDGELARLRFQESPAGAWLDRISDKLVMALFFGAVFAGVAHGDAGPALRAAGLVSVAGFGVGLPLAYLYGHLRRHAVAAHAVHPAHPAHGPYPPHAAHPTRPLARARRWFDLVAFEIVFGGHLARVGGQGGGATARGMAKFALLLKNDVLALVYLALALAGRLASIFWVVAPLGVALLLVAAAGMALLAVDRVAGGGG